MTKLVPLPIRLEPDIRDALLRAAKDDGRSLSGMAHKALSDWLRDKGHVGPTPMSDDSLPASPRDAIAAGLRKLTGHYPEYDDGLDADVILAALAQAEPTDAMLRAGSRAADGRGTALARAVWTAMLKEAANGQ